MLDWHIGLVVAVCIPLGVFAVAVFWPARMPKEKSVRAIRERIECEDTGRQSG
ncbi:hypothetical protein [Nocardia gamkensis]|uniref:Uncharacterized protein n=1 Tax=Nocardia gamkensis TaxID=352869 RepID=A0A7X6L7W8_9NOCA|nr:hypothetical protein [Nocardia gamkensis]NKY29282.1 hypothetical protein [Nocardia gamkensis]NQE67121.1 hypothetical protein [Nocardia gamkensis]